jgi:hypothetical protein
MWPGVERSLGITGCGGWSNGMEVVVVVVVGGVSLVTSRSKLVQRIIKRKKCPCIDGLYVVVDGPTEEWLLVRCQRITSARHYNARGSSVKVGTNSSV